MIRKTLTTLFLFFIMGITALAQPGNTEMADTMRSNGKIYVVVAIVLTIFAGVIIYLIRLDRKLSRLEKHSS